MWNQEKKEVMKDQTSKITDIINKWEEIVRNVMLPKYESNSILIIIFKILLLGKNQTYHDMNRPQHYELLSTTSMDSFIYYTIYLVSAINPRVIHSFLKNHASKS